MTRDDMILVSVDDHIVEPPTVFERHTPAKWAARAPRLLYDPKRGTQTWTWEGGASATPFICAVVTLPNEEWGYDPTTIAEMRPGCYDHDARVRDMDANGILASMCFPSFTGMGGSFFASCPDKDLAYACLQAYNDWHIDEWCGSHPGRFIPLPLSPLWSPELAAKEVRRVARKGVTAIAFSEAPETFGHPSIHSGAWDPFFAACQDEDMTIGIHIASSNVGRPDPAVPMEISSTLPCWNALACAANFLWCKSLVKYPNVKIALSEGGTSWIPGFLDRMERQFTVQKWVKSDLGGLTPTEKFRRHFLACFVCDPSGLLLRDRIGIDNIAYEVDYPHSDCTFPGSPEELWEHFEMAKCNDAEIAKVSHENALRWLRFDPFAHRPRERATVAALRADARDVDLRTRSKADYRRAYEATHGPVG
ncbi:MAG TPA: amidohydrolase family protein [Candidatus Binatia bacterium]|jgi:predicted TIM-barrel fold metal-dependent hydrolase|nr:amidohydrolase family protein [Candidatus Binatia bacterium]